MGNYGNKIGFGGTDEILRGVGRSPPKFLPRFAEPTFIFDLIS